MHSPRIVDLFPTKAPDQTLKEFDELLKSGSQGIQLPAICNPDPVARAENYKHQIDLRI